MRSFKKIERFRVEKKEFKKCCLYYSRSVCEAENNTTQKTSISLCFEMVKQGSKVQDKEEYLAFTAK